MRLSSSTIVALCALAAPLTFIACSPAPRIQTPDGGDGGPAADGAAPPAVTFAANGVAIPAPDPKNNCGMLGIELASCDVGTPCPTIECDCPAGKLTVWTGFTCVGPGGCVAAVSCDVACQVGMGAFESVAFCVSRGLCATDADCGAGRTCIRTPGQSRGSCSGHQVGEECLVDSDCASSACVVRSPSWRMCTSRDERAPCNRDSHCAAGRCLLENGKYDGVCSDGSNGDLCLEATDCQAGLRCLGNIYRECSDGNDDSLCATVDDCRPGYACVPVELTATGSKCSSGEVGGRCSSNAECRGGFCVNDSFDRGTCSDGALGATCQFPTQCKSGFCGAGKCTTGEPGAVCAHDEDCATGKCDNKVGTPPPTHCTNG